MDEALYRCSKLRALNAAASADGLATGRIPASKALDLLMSARSQAVWKQAVTATPQLREFYGPQHEERIGEFKSLEARRRLTNVDIVRGQHAAGIPRGNMGAMNTIRAEIGRRRGP